MTSLFRECYNRFHVGKRLFSFFLASEVRRKIYFAVWTAIVIAPSFIESVPLSAAQVKQKLVDSDAVFLKCRLQDVGREDHIQGLTEFGDLRCERLSQLHAREASGVDVGEAKSKAERNPSTNQSTEKSEYRFFHEGPTIDGIIGGVAGLIVGSILVVLLCKYVWFA
jgi:hypothetical protein